MAEHVNSNDAPVVGAVIQARTISGGVHLHPPAPETPRQLVPPPRVFVGRDAELAELTAAAAASPVVVTGPGGVGKTTLARRWAQQNSPRFPDGQLSVDLGGTSAATAADPGDALGHLLRALGVPAAQVPAGLGEQAARYRSLTAGRALLIMLDDAFSAAQVRALLPGPGPGLVLVTSRHRLAGLIADGGVTVEVRPWAEADSIDLLSRALGPARVDRERTGAERLARICGGLPMALAVVAARLATRPRLPLARLAADLDEETTRLRGLRTVDGVSVLASLDLSYQDLDPAARAVYRRLAALPGRSYGSGPVAAVAGSAEVAGAAVDLLIHANLLEETGTDRLGQHDLLFLHAGQRFESDETPDDRLRIRRRALEWYLAAATVAERVLTPYRRVPFSYRYAGPPPDLPHLEDRARALDWLDDERAALIAAGRAALASGWNDLAWHLCDVLWPLLLLRKHYRDRPAIDECGVTAAQRWGNRWAEADMRKRLGDALAEAGRFGPAEEQLRRAEAGFRAAADPRGETEALERIASLYRDTGRLREAADRYEQALAAHRAAGDLRRTGLTLIRLGSVLPELGAPAGAVGHLLAAREVFRQLADVDPYNGRRAETALARALLATGDLAAAAEAADRGATGMLALGSLFEHAQAVEVLARVAAARGDAEESRRHLARAREIYTELGSPRAGELGDPVVVDGDGQQPDRD